MIKSTANSRSNAISVLKNDHVKVKGLFEKFKLAGAPRSKTKIAAEAIEELKIHSAIEEEIFYPAVRTRIGKKIMNEADEEHHVAKILIAELEEMNGKEDHYDAKFAVLAENVRHHIKEEERDMLPKAKSLSIDMRELARQMLARKTQLLKNGVATFAEEKMVSMSKGKGDSSATAAKIVKPRPSKRTKARAD